MFEGLNLVLVAFLVLSNGFFVASEFALVGSRRSRISTMAAAGDKKAARLLGLGCSFLFFSVDRQLLFRDRSR
jgi:CBS domain containing-hemolysin-like protein